MSLLIRLALVTAAATSSLALAALSFAATGNADASQNTPPVRPTLTQKQLVSATNCQTAAHAPAKPQFLSTNAEYRDDVVITTRYCSATAHNQLTPTKPEILVVSADPTAAGDHKIFFRTIRPYDAHAVHDTCVLAGKAAFAYLQASTATPQSDAAIAGADVLTSSGKMDCDGFLRTTDAKNPLVVLAPAGLTGAAISVHILNMIGLKRPTAEVQAAVDTLGHQVAGSVALSADEIRKQPQIVLGAPGANVR
jgi:hypothetical protein